MGNFMLGATVMGSSFDAVRSREWVWPEIPDDDQIVRGRVAFHR